MADFDFRAEMADEFEDLARDYVRQHPDEFENQGPAEARAAFAGKIQAGGTLYLTPAEQQLEMNGQAPISTEELSKRMERLAGYEPDGNLEQFLLARHADCKRPNLGESYVWGKLAEKFIKELSIECRSANTESANQFINAYTAVNQRRFSPTPKNMLNLPPSWFWTDPETGKRWEWLYFGDLDKEQLGGSAILAIAPMANGDTRTVILAPDRRRELKVDVAAEMLEKIQVPDERKKPVPVFRGDPVETIVSGFRKARSTDRQALPTLGDLGVPEAALQIDPEKRWIYLPKRKKSREPLETPQGQLVLLIENSPSNGKVKIVLDDGAQLDTSAALLEKIEMP